MISLYLLSFFRNILNKKITKKVCILESSFIITEGIKQIVTGINDFRIKACFSSLNDLETSTEMNDCSLLVCNPDMIKNAQALVKLRIKYPASKILIIDTEKNSFKDIFTPSTVDGYIFLCCHTDEVLNALLSVANGEKFFCDNALSHFVSDKNRMKSCNPVNLSERELEVLRLIVKGFSSKEISKELNVSFHTITTHRKNIARKLKVKKMSELIATAHNLKIV